MTGIFFYPLAALPLGLSVLLWALPALLLAFIAFELHMGWSLFRYATKRVETDQFTPPADIPQETLDWYKRVAVTRERLLLQAHEDWELKRGRISLRGTFFPARQGHAAGLGCALLVHGWRDVRMSRAVDVEMYLDMGYSVFMPTLRGHAPSGGRRIDIGCLYRKDLFAWMEEVRKRLDQAPHHFILDGLSMGAANVLTAAGDQDLPEDVAAILADCGYSSLLAQGQWMTRGIKPLLRIPALYAATIFFYLFMGYSKKAPTPLTQAGKSRVPIFFIHGTQDQFVPTFMGQELYSACASPVKELWLVEGAGHAMSYATAGQAYQARKAAFIRRALAGD